MQEAGGSLQHQGGGIKGGQHIEAGRAEEGEVR